MKGGAEEMQDAKLSGEDQSNLYATPNLTKIYKSPINYYNQLDEDVSDTKTVDSVKDAYNQDYLDDIERLETQLTGCKEEIETYKKEFKSEYNFFTEVLEKLGKSHFDSTSFKVDLDHYILNNEVVNQTIIFRNSFDTETKGVNVGSNEYKTIKNDFSKKEFYGKYVDKAKYNKDVKQVLEFKNKYGPIPDNLNKTSFEQTTFKRHHDSRFSINSNKCWTFKNYHCLLDQRKKGTVCIIDFCLDLRKKAS